MRVLLAVIAASAFVSSSAAAAESDRSQQPQAESARQAGEREEQAERLVCRTIEDSGTRLTRRRICLTREAWRARADLRG